MNRQGSVDEAVHSPSLPGEQWCESDGPSRVARLVYTRVRDSASHGCSGKDTHLRVRVDIFAEGSRIDAAHSKPPYTIIEVM